MIAVMNETIEDIATRLRRERCYLTLSATQDGWRASIATRFLRKMPSGVGGTALEAAVAAEEELDEMREKAEWRQGT